MVTVRVGSFVKANATGNQDISLPAGLPDMTAQAAGTWAILFWSGGSLLGSGSWDQHVVNTLGFTTGAANSYAVGGQETDAQATAQTARRMAAKCITVPTGDGAGIYYEADFVSFPTSNSMRINWTTNNAWAANICYMVITGLTGAKVVTWTDPATAINKSVTGVGFNPDLIFHASIGKVAVASDIFALFQFGVVNKHGQQWANGWASNDNVSPSNTSRWQQTDACLTSVSGGEIANAQAHHVSTDADGFTVNFSQTDNGVTNIALCLDGISSKIGAFVKTASVGSQVIPTRHEFTLKGALFSHIDGSPQPGPFTTAVWSMGATDFTNVRSIMLRDTDAVNPTQADSVWSSSAPLMIGTAAGSPPTLVGTGTVSGSSSDVTVTWSSSNGETTEILYCLLGDAGVNTYPSAVGV